MGCFFDYIPYLYLMLSLHTHDVEISFKFTTVNLYPSIPPIYTKLSLWPKHPWGIWRGHLRSLGRLDADLLIFSGEAFGWAALQKAGGGGVPRGDRVSHQS